MSGKVERADRAERAAARTAEYWGRTVQIIGLLLLLQTLTMPLGRENGPVFVFRVIMVCAFLIEFNCALMGFILSERQRHRLWLYELKVRKEFLELRLRTWARNVRLDRAPELTRGDLREIDDI